MRLSMTRIQERSAPCHMWMPNWHPCHLSSPLMDICERSQGWDSQLELSHKVPNVPLPCVTYWTIWFWTLLFRQIRSNQGSTTTIPKVDPRPGTLEEEYKNTPSNYSVLYFETAAERRQEDLAVERVRRASIWRYVPSWRLPKPGLDSELKTSPKQILWANLESKVKPMFRRDHIFGQDFPENDISHIWPGYTTLLLDSKGLSPWGVWGKDGKSADSQSGLQAVISNRGLLCWIPSGLFSRILPLK